MIRKRQYLRLGKLMVVHFLMEGDGGGGGFKNTFLGNCTFFSSSLIERLPIIDNTTLGTFAQKRAQHIFIYCIL